MKSLPAIAFLFALLMTHNPGFTQDILINEIMSSNSSTVYDEDGDTPDWIELFNGGNETINLYGYGISDDITDLFKWTLPDFNIPANGHLLIFASDKDRSGQGQWETIIDWGDDWNYYLPQSQLPETWITLGYNDSGWSDGMSGFGYGDNDDATIVAQTMSVYARKTFSTSQLPAILDAILHVDYDDAFVAYLNGQEIARANIGTPGSFPAFNEPSLEVTEPVICYGGTPAGYPINPSLLSDINILAIEVHNFDIGSSDLSLIPFFSVLLENAPPNPNGTPPLLQLDDPGMHTNFKISAAGETIYLTNPSNILIDSLQTGDLPINVSIGRQPDGSDNWCYFNEPSPGQVNSGECWPGITDAVQFSLPGGFYSSVIQLQLNTDDPGDIIYYTLDGTEPGLASGIYTNTLYITVTTVVRAIAWHSGYLPGRSVTNTYLINVEHDLPVFSISTAPENLFDPVIGIYHDNNVWEDWERPVHVEFWDTDDSSGFSIDAGVKIFGGWTRTLPQKSLAIYARESYGYGEVDYPLFPDLPFEKYETFVLRNSGNDWQNTMFRDGLMTGLVAGDGIDIQAFRPSVVYINGQYWGIHNIREKLNDRYVDMHYGIDPDTLDLLENQQWPLNGDAIHYNQMISFITDHPMSDPDNYEYIKTQMDIENFITYEVSQIYFGNTDWPGNNIKYWRPRIQGGKWKWMLYDTDFGFGLVNDYTHNTLAFATDPAGPDWPNPPWSTFLLRQLLTNDEFRIDFINRYADLLNSSFRSNVIIEQIDQKRAAIQDEMPNQCARWGGNTWQWLANVQVLQTFASQRKSHAQNHVIQHFDLVSDSQVTLDVFPESAGNIKISTLTLDDFPWSGEYFNGIPVEITATANPGYRFIRWEGSYFSDTNSITLIFTGNKDLTAVFEAYTPVELVINEINYNSAATFDPGDWIELYNPNAYEVDLTLWAFKDEEDSHSYSFEPETMIGSNGFLVLCADTLSFNSLFPNVLKYTGNIDFGLNGGGELIRLYDFSGLLIDSVRYDDAKPWPEEADGNGPTLELLDPGFDNALPESWTASGQNGTPGNPNGIYIMIRDHEKEDPVVFIVPNPFTADTKFLLVSGMEQEATIEIFNYSGLRVMAFSDINLACGTHQVTWDGKNAFGHSLPAGIYICKVSSKKQSIIRKVIKTD
jgi:hypothetical protein